MKYKKLAGTDEAVSVLSLGSYETYSRMEYADIVALVSKALESGINLFDVAHYRRAPHTEVVLSRALSDAGAKREDYLLMTKVWKSDDGKTTSAEELRNSLFRLGTDYVDLVLIYGPRWGVDEPYAHASEAIDLVNLGLSRYWGGINWSAKDIDTATRAAEDDGHSSPKLMQLKYNLARRSLAESPEYLEVFERSGMQMQASDSLEGGVLAGKMGGERVLGRDPGRIRPQIEAAMPRVTEIAHQFGVSPAELSLAFAIAFDHTAGVLFGASKLSQLEANVRAVDLATNHGADIRRALDEIRIEGHTLDVPPGSNVPPELNPYE